MWQNLSDKKIFLYIFWVKKRILTLKDLLITNFITIYAGIGGVENSVNKTQLFVQPLCGGMEH